jgi:predicted small secreted protein
MPARWHHCAFVIAVARAQTASKRPQARGPAREMETMFNRWITGILMLAALLSTGCNTIQGAGKDLERGGQVIRDTARDVQKRF